MRLVIHPPIDAERLDRIRAVAGDAVVVNADSTAAALEAIRDAEAFFGKLTPELLAAAKRLKWVQSPTASLEHYLFPELIEHPCQLSNMRGLFSDVIADHVLGYVLMFARNLHHYLRQQWNRQWAPIGGEEARTGFETGPGQVSAIDRRHRHLADCQLGVIGVGSIGSEILRRAAAFGMRLRGVDPQTRSVPGVLDEVGGLDQLDELLAECDFVVIAAPHTPETFKLIGRQQLRQMRSDAYLINIGRGVIVDLEDLTAALESGEIAGAALDVFEIEPLPADHRLWELPNAILTPHIAAASPRVAERHLETVCENVRRFVAGEPLLTAVDKRKWY